MLRWLTCKKITGEIVLCPLNVHDTQSILWLIFLMFVATKQRLNYSEQESKEQFAVYDSHILVTLK